jgi:hypothetical protein
MSDGLCDEGLTDLIKVRRTVPLDCRSLRRAIGGL